MICERSMIRLNIPNKGNESGKSKKVIYHCQAKKEKTTKKDMQQIIKKTKDLTTGTPLILGTDIRFCERGSSSCFTSDTRRVSDK